MHSCDFCGRRLMQDEHRTFCPRHGKNYRRMG